MRWILDNVPSWLIFFILAAFVFSIPFWSGLVENFIRKSKRNAIIAYGLLALFLVYMLTSVVLDIRETERIKEEMNYYKDEEFEVWAEWPMRDSKGPFEKAYLVHHKETGICFLMVKEHLGAGITQVDCREFE